ncbi:MAG: putative 4-hydroxybenzoate polyprenyltransferase [Myxococcales bacterium]|nr:putative 4-hydroxybenzoate polyprenyltransferase [Myxococcales bacterium]MDD9970767.1 putative 4-hydroxybenzoate polyprenyltransferase [Myxococcales bacterium]
MSFARTVGHYSSLVKLSHTVFALPFALAAALLATRYAELTVKKLLLIVLCIASARTAAMAFNRLVDRHIDAKNPRTQQREIPAGVLSPGAVRGLVVASCAVFVASAAALGRLPLVLSPIVLVVLLGYSFTKRFTSLCHLVLGVAVALAPGGAWIAMGAPVTIAPWLMVIGVASWVAGFDILYSLQDHQFDRAERLHSIPVALGVVGALWLSGGLHVVTVACLLGAGLALGTGWPYTLGVGLIGAILVYEHAIVRPSDLSRIDRAFFDLNGYVSLAFLACVVVDQVLA